MEHYHIPSTVLGAGDKAVKKTDKNLQLMPRRVYIWGRGVHRKIGGREGGEKRKEGKKGARRQERGGEK